MRSVITPRAGRLACALSLSLTAAAGAAAPSVADAAAPSLKLADGRLAYGERASASGRADRALAGRRVSLEFRRAAAPAGDWQELAGATVGAAGRYRVRVSRLPGPAVRMR